MHNIIPSLSDTPIRIGFGKIDSVPTAQPSASTQQYSLSNSSASSLAGQSDAGSDDGKSISGGNLADRLQDVAKGLRDDDNTSATRAIWIGNLPSHVTAAVLINIFAPFGTVESARVLANKQCGFVNFNTVEAASSARTALHGREFLGNEVGPVKIGFARAPPQKASNSPDQPDTTTFASVDGEAGRAGAPMTQENVANIEEYGGNLVRDLINKGGPGENSSAEAVPASGTMPPRLQVSDIVVGGDVSEQQAIMTVLSQGDPNLAADVQSVGKHSEQSALYYSYIPVLPDRSQYRKFDPVTLKDIRRRLDGGHCSPSEIDQVAQDLMDSCTTLASDYIGNTIIQKLYANTSKAIRLEMLNRIAPQLALTGTHKNGTWAAQKIIECATSEEEMSIIARNLSPYVPPLSADSYGNYLVSACLRFAPPSNTFVYDAMVDKTWDIAQTRFGARCMRTCLESPHTTFFQKKRLASAIIIHSIPLATNPNGALLLTWLMDANELPGRFGLLAKRLAGFVQHLVTHKLASLTVLRIVNQKNEPDAAKTMLDAMFKSPNDQVLREILQDQVHGAHAISKIVSSGVIISKEDKPEAVAAVKRVLESMRNVSGLTYKRLLEECGLPVPAVPTGQARGSSRREGPLSRGRDNHHQMPRGYGGGVVGGGGGRSGYPNGGQPMANYNQFSLVPDMNRMMSSMQAFQLGQGMTGSLSPLLANQPSFGQALTPNMGSMSPTPTLGSFGTPHAQLMSPSSDPFNPVSRVSSFHLYIGLLLTRDRETDH